MYIKNIEDLEEKLKNLKAAKLILSERLEQNAQATSLSLEKWTDIPYEIQTNKNAKICQGEARL